MAVKTKKKQHGFQPGQSGNPAGRPRGSRNKATIAAETLLDGEAQALSRKAVELALEGEKLLKMLDGVKYKLEQKKKPFYDLDGLLDAEL